MAAKKIKVWLDVDTGIDDAHAILLALRSPEFEVCGISCVAGNAHVDIVLESTLRVCDAAAAPSDLIVARGCSHAFIEPPHVCPEIHGNDSLGDLQPPLPPSKRRRSSAHAVAALIEMLESSTDKVTIICLAPLTNIATALRSAPSVFSEKVERLVWMGGAMAVGGNATPWAEANAFYDPEACHVVLTSGLPILMYTWDMYLTVEVSGADLDAMGLGASVDLTAPRSGWAGASDAASSGSLGHFLDGACCLGARLLHRDMKHWAMTSVMVGDAGAVAAVLLPGAVTTRRMHVGVELTGTLTRGMTVCDQRPVVFEPDRARGPLNVDVVVAVDGAALARLYALRVLAPPSNSPYVVRGPPIEKTPLTHAPQPPKCDISTPRHSTVRPSSFQTALRFSVVISALYVVSSAAMSLARR